MNTSRRRRPDPKQLESESSFYDVYNNLAEAYDVEMIKDWNESLNFLLVFVSIHHLFPFISARTVDLSNAQNSSLHNMNDGGCRRQSFLQF